MDNLSINEFDLYHLGVSGGKDSTAVLLWLIYESGLPLEKVIVSFCDTGNEDALTYAYLDMLSEKVFSITKLYPDLDFWQLAKSKKRFPSTKARFCTTHLKIIPSRDFILNLMKTGANVLLLNGVRREEGHGDNGRGNAAVYEFDYGYGTYIYRPIVEWSLSQVWDIHKKYLLLEDVLELLDKDQALEHKEDIIFRMLKHKIPRNPLYDMGAVRVGCFPCINSRKAEIRAMDKYRPQRIDFIAEKEIEVGENRGDGISTFFPRGFVPEAHRTKKINVRGVEMNVPTIYDVVDWAKTAWGGRSYDFDFMYEDSPIACDIRGLCE